jgi:hypothetical protein
MAFEPGRQDPRSNVQELFHHLQRIRDAKTHPAPPERLAALHREAAGPFRAGAIKASENGERLSEPPKTHPERGIN